MKVLFRVAHKEILNYCLDKSVLLENTPLVKFIRNYIRDLSDLSSIISLVKILIISLKSSLSLIVLKFIGVWSQHLWVFFESLQQSSEIFGTTTLWVLPGVASPTTTPSSVIWLPTALPVWRHLLLFSPMWEASLRECCEYFVTTALKWVTNLPMFCAHVSRDQRTNLLPCSAEVLFTRLAALITILYAMDRLIEPWKQG